ncbi:unnamed protein product [Penicillium olsonii]|nr:unnamed protein product [Penicillium olsonii]
MKAHYHCDAHNGLPRVWLGWGELKSRKPELQATQDNYFEEYMVDYKFRHPKHPRRWYNLHLAAARKWTRWFDWRISRGDKVRLTLPEPVNNELIPSLLHFIYTGDYSVDIADMDRYPVREDPSGCDTCPQICQLLRIHLDMFIIGLQLGMVELQATAFYRFRSLMNTAPAWVLKYAVHAVYTRRPIESSWNDFRISSVQGLMDYRPELVLPAILRWCGYFRMHPMRISGSTSKMCGVEEFEELRKRYPDFSCHLDFGIVLDTVDILPPFFKFPGKSAPMIALHQYDRPPPTPSPDALPRDHYRSNYQYVTYLQPLPFSNFSEQLPSNLGTFWSSSSQIDQPMPTSNAALVQKQVSGQPQKSQPGPVPVVSNALDPALSHLTFDQLESISEDSILNTDSMDSSASQFDPMQLDGDFELDLDFIAAENAANPDGYDLTKLIQDWGGDNPDMDFTSLLSSSMTTDFLNPSTAQPRQAMDVDMPAHHNPSGPNDFDFAIPSLPTIDWTGMDPMGPMNFPQNLGATGWSGIDSYVAAGPQQQSIRRQQKAFDWSKATHSGGTPVEEAPPQPAVRANSRYNLRSRGTPSESPQQDNKRSASGDLSDTPRNKRSKRAMQ